MRGSIDLRKPLSRGRLGSAEETKHSRGSIGLRKLLSGGRLGLAKGGKETELKREV